MPLNDNIPPGYCQCGCGKRVGIFRHGRKWQEGNAYIPSHRPGWRLPHPGTPRNPRNLRLWNGQSWELEWSEDLGCYRVPLRGMDGLGKFALVDACDFEKVSRRKWWARSGSRTHYAVSTERRSMSMHRMILELDDPETHVDHVNGNGLDNRRANLRLATKSQNAMNKRRNRNSRSPYKGINCQKGRWRSFINVNGKKRALGSFDTAEDAARAYDRAAKEHFGAYACLNFPDE